MRWLTVICKGRSAKSISSDGQQSAVSVLTGIRGSQTIQNKLEAKRHNRLHKAIKLPAPLRSCTQEMLYSVAIVAFTEREHKYADICPKMIPGCRWGNFSPAFFPPFRSFSLNNPRFKPSTRLSVFIAALADLNC